MSIATAVRSHLHERAHDCCEVCGGPGANNAHHRRNRSQGGSDTLSNLLLVCGSGTTGCHGRITLNPDWAESLGYTIKGAQRAPSDIWILRFDRTIGRALFVCLNDDGDIVQAVAA